MKKNKGLYLLVSLFCLCVSGASVYAASYDAQNEVGVKFVDSTSATSNSIDSSTSASNTKSSSTSLSSIMQSSSSLPGTSKKREVFLWLENNDDGSGGDTCYYTDDKLLPNTGELIHLALPFAGVFLIMIIFFSLKKGREKAHG